MKAYLIAYVVAALAMLGLDAIWLGTMSARLYRPLLGDILLDGFRPAPAIAFYLLYVLGIVIFAVQPAFASGRWTSALLYGGLYGFFCYATYDLTNQATLKSWSTTITFVDIAWGVLLSAGAASIAFLVASRFADSPAQV